MADPRIVGIEIDNRSVVRWNPDIDHERRVAIFDLLEENSFAPEGGLTNGYGGPYKIVLRIEEGRLAFDLQTEAGDPLGTFGIAVGPFRRIIREYFGICDAYFKAIKSSTPSQIEAIDMGRRGLHNEGSQLLLERLAGKATVDFGTARRLFTLMCVLHIRSGNEHPAAI